MGDRLATMDMGRKWGGGCAFLRGGWVPISHNVAWAEAYLHATWHPDPSNCLATIHQRHRQTGQTDSVPIAVANGFTNGRPKSHRRRQKQNLTEFTHACGEETEK